MEEIKEDQCKVLSAYAIVPQTKGKGSKVVGSSSQRPLCAPLPQLPQLYHMIMIDKYIVLTKHNNAKHRTSISNMISWKINVRYGSNQWSAKDLVGDRNNVQICKWLLLCISNIGLQHHVTTYVKYIPPHSIGMYIIIVNHKSHLKTM